MILTKTQIKRIKKAASKGTGVDLKIPKTQIRKAIQKGGSLFSSIMPLLGKVLPYASKVAGPLLTGALSGLSTSLGVNKLFGSAKGGFLKQPSVISQLMPYIGQFTPAQQRKILKATQSGSRLVLRPTVSQRGWVYW